MSAPGMSETSRHLRRLTAVRLRASTLCYRYARIEKGDLSIQLKSPYFLGSPEVGFTEPSGVWDKFHIYQGHRRNTAFIGIGRRHRPRRLKVDKHPNALKQALHYRELLESGHADSQGELSRLCGTPRTTISAYLRLLGLDEELRAEALNLSDEDERVARLTEPRLRHLVGLQPAEQLRRFRALLDATEPHEASRRVR